jgi:hypothetical protein
MVVQLHGGFAERGVGGRAVVSTGEKSGLAARRPLVACARRRWWPQDHANYPGPERAQRDDQMCRAPWSAAHRCSSSTWRWKGYSATCCAVTPRCLGRKSARRDRRGLLRVMTASREKRGGRASGSRKRNHWGLNGAAFVPATGSWAKAESVSRAEAPGRDSPWCRGDGAARGQTLRVVADPRTPQKAGETGGADPRAKDWHHPRPRVPLGG